MASQALIKINGIDSHFTAVAIGSTVNLSNHDAGGEASYAWQIVDQPEGTADTLSSTGIENVSFTPTKEGSYEIKLTVDAALPTVAVQTAIVTVLDARTGERFPAATETLESGVQGWALALKRILPRALRSTVDNNVILVQTPGGIAIGSIVTLTGTAVINAGTQAVFTVPSMAAALATSTHRERLGVLIDGVSTGLVTAGLLTLVRTFGLVPIAGAGSPSVGDPVFLSDTGTPALVAGTIARTIGYVVASSAGAYQWVIDSGVQHQGRMLAAPIRLTGSGSGTFPAGTCVVQLDGIAGGGGGGGAKGNAISAGGGGGSSGMRLRKTIGTPGVPFTTLAYSWVSGTGGTGGLGATPTSGGTGNDTTVTINGTTFTMKGGGGGVSATGATFGLSPSSAPAAGTSGVAGESSYGPGQPGLMLNNAAWMSGNGGATDLGSGGLTVGGTTVGNPGQGMGGGGSGGAATGAGTANGGNGADGGAWVTPFS